MPQSPVKWKNSSLFHGIAVNVEVTNISVIFCSCDDRVEEQRCHGISMLYFGSARDKRSCSACFHASAACSPICEEPLVATLCVHFT